MQTTLFWVMALGTLVLAAGCGDEGGSGLSASQKQATSEIPTASGGPSVEVSADKTHAVQPGDVVTLTISVEDFVLDPAAIGQGNAFGVGHYRVYLDNPSGDQHLAEGAGNSVRVTIPDTTTDGSHDLRVVLHNNDRTPLSPTREASVLLIIYRL